VDFKKGKLPVGPPPEHKLLATEVRREMKEAGYELVHRDVALPYQYVLVFKAE
jgi:hypothetical protein